MSDIKNVEAKQDNKNEEDVENKDSEKTIEDVLEKIGLSQYLDVFTKKNYNKIIDFKQYNLQFIKENFKIANIVDANNISNAIREEIEGTQGIKRPVDKGFIACAKSCYKLKLDVKDVICYKGNLYTLTEGKMICKHVKVTDFMVVFKDNHGNKILQTMFKYESKKNMFKCVSTTSSPSTTSKFKADCLKDVKKINLQKIIDNSKELSEFLTDRYCYLQSEKAKKELATYQRRLVISKRFLEDTATIERKRNYSIDDYKIMSQDSSLSEVYYNTNAKWNASVNVLASNVGVSAESNAIALYLAQSLSTVDSGIMSGPLSVQNVEELKKNDKLWIFMKGMWLPFYFYTTYVIGGDEEFGFFAQHRANDKIFVFPIQKKYVDNNFPNLPYIYFQQ